MLLNPVTRAAEQVHNLAVETGLKRFPLGQVRTALRLALGTWPSPQQTDARDGSHGPAGNDRAPDAARFNPATAEGAGNLLPAAPLAGIANALAEHLSGNVLLGFPASPFVLVLRPEDPDALAGYVSEHGAEIEVMIRRPERHGTYTGNWVIEPLNGHPGFRLHFTLPDQMANWLLRNGDTAANARVLKEKLLSSITVFVEGRLVRLSFDSRHLD
ncbi:hypothetical protein [Amycolatopsis sp. NPDC059021]|uniref:hypothetical protein n=1 Tax=Amycolatopsis sp. NPDC059021 TaxID=3346704 RepID=UPI00366FB0CF